MGTTGPSLQGFCLTQRNLLKPNPFLQGKNSTVFQASFRYKNEERALFGSSLLEGAGETRLTTNADLQSAK
jgi:hypothetical protein